jgi:hypothetical protein
MELRNVRRGGAARIDGHGIRRGDPAGFPGKKIRPEVLGNAQLIS